MDVIFSLTPEPDILSLKYGWMQKTVGWIFHRYLTVQLTINDSGLGPSDVNISNKQLVYW